MYSRVSNLLWVISDCIPFLRQKAAFWIPLTRYGINLARKYRGDPGHSSTVGPDWVFTPLFLNLTSSLEQHTELAVRYEVNNTTTVY